MHSIEETGKRNGSVGRRSVVRRVAAEAECTWDFTSCYDALTKHYRLTKEPVLVDFRKLVPLRSGVDRFTHLIHSYPAKLIANIPLFFLNCSNLSEIGNTIWDPFCGTGTSLLEAVLAGRHASGADANPLARLITRVKLTKIRSSLIERALLDIVSTARKLDPTVFQPVVNVEHWFSTRSIREIGQLKSGISEVQDQTVQDFFLVCLSAIIRKCSAADPRLSVPVRRKGYKYDNGVDVFSLFSEVVQKNAERISRLNSISDELLMNVELENDARAPHHHGKCDLILTSPPYVGAQKYIRSSSLSIGWLGLAPEAKLRNLEKQNIGREHFSYDEFQSVVGVGSPNLRIAIAEIAQISPIRAHIALTYFREMSVVIANMYSRLKDGGSLVMITGDNTIAGRTFSTSKLLQEMTISTGMRVELEVLDEIPSRGLMTKRNKAAACITREHVTVFRKL